jgi:HlyD family secretion protein
MATSEFTSTSTKHRVWLVLIFIMCSAGIALAYAMFRHKAPVDYIADPIERGSIITVVNATGSVQPVVTVQVGSQVSGKIETLYADYNSIVKRGQLLAKIDPRNFQAQVKDAEANLAAAKAREQSAKADLITMNANLVSAKANLEAARVTRDNDALTFNRYKEMMDSGIIAQNDFDTVKTTAENSAAKCNQAAAAVEQAQAQIKAQQAQIDQAGALVKQAEADLDDKRVNLEYTDIFSPIDGVVISRNVDVGQTVAAGLQAPLLFVIANDLIHMQVNASVDEADIGLISPNVDVKFTVDAFPMRSFTGKIQEIRLDPQTVQNVVTYSVIIAVDNSSLYLKPGMTANITITADKKRNVLKIPNAALRYLPPGMTRAQEIELARAQEGTTHEVAETGYNGNSRSAFSSSPQNSGKEQPGTGQLRAAAAVQKNGERSGAAKSAGPSGAGSLFAGQAPGQLWNPSDKIQFPAMSGPAPKPGIVWILDSHDKPVAQHVMLGITDGSYTELVSGDLKSGERLIVADSSQEASNSPQAQASMRGPFGGFGGRR